MLYSILRFYAIIKRSFVIENRVKQSVFLGVCCIGSCNKTLQIKLLENFFLKEPPKI